MYVNGNTIIFLVFTSITTLQIITTKTFLYLNEVVFHTHKYFEVLRMSNQYKIKVCLMLCF